MYIYNETITDCVSTSENKFAQVKSKELPVSRLLQTKSNRMNVYITTQMAKSPLKYCPVLSQSEHNRLDNNSTNFTVQTCTKLSLPLISGCRQRK